MTILDPPRDGGARLRRAVDHFDANELFAGGGEMGALMRSLDWAATPLGPPERWPQSLRTTVSLLLNSRYPMFVFWGQALVKIYNDGYRPILATKHPWALGRPGPEVWPEIWSQIGPMVATVIEKGEATWSEDLVVFMERNGFPEECYFTFSYSPVRDESGGVGGMFCACTETTKQVLGERRMNTLRELAARPADASIVDEACRLSCEVLAGNIEDLPFARLYLFDAADGAARLVAASGTPGDAGENGWPLARVSETGRPEIVSDLDTRLAIVPRGAWPEPPKQAMVLPLVAPGHERAVGAVVLGIGSRRAIDEPYRDFLVLVTNQIATSIAKVRAFEEERRRAEALAELDRAKTAFFSNVSHEFRTPLTLMMGPIEDGLADVDQPLAPEQRRRQELVRRNGLRLQKLVNTLLDFARMEAGRAHASFVPADLASLTSDLASTFRSAVESAGLSLVVDCAPLSQPVPVDPSMWEKIVLNLLSNALKYTWSGSIRVTLEQDAAAVVLAVADTGTGIAPEELPRIFDPFHRVEGVRGRSHEGTGIGLALVRELAQLHGGEVGVESVVDPGSTFSVTIPLRQPTASTEHAPAWTGADAEAFLAEASQWSAARAETTASDVADAPRILVADDNADMRDYITRLLSPSWRVEAVADGLQALAAAQASPPDLVLSDVMMPGMDGLQLIRALRADDRTRTIPIVLLSARAGEEATVDGLASGADAYLTKPFSAHELVARVSAQLALADLREQAIRRERSHSEEATRLLAEARAATRAREDTVAIVSHDLRAPLATIRTAAEIIARARVEGEHAERVHDKARVIERSVVGMVRLLGDLLDISSIESGTLAIDPRPQDVGAIFDEIRDTFADAAQQRRIELAVRVAPSVGPVLADKDRIVQALTNLVGNAIKFTPEGGRVQVRAERAQDAVLFTVEDTGPGIAPEAMRHIFDRYWHSAQSGEVSHGLGLSIAKGIALAHGGTLAAESELGAGSRFTLSLPLPSSA